MEIETDKLGKIDAVKPVGRLDSVTAGELQEALDPLLTSPGAHILLDLSAVTYISSAGLRTVLATSKRLASSQGKLHLCGLAGMVQEVFRLAHLDGALPVFADRQEAIDGF